MLYDTPKSIAVGIERRMRVPDYSLRQDEPTRHDKGLSAGDSDDRHRATYGCACSHLRTRTYADECQRLILRARGAAVPRHGHGTFWPMNRPSTTQTAWKSRYTRIRTTWASPRGSRLRRHRHRSPVADRRGAFCADRPGQPRLAFRRSARTE